MTTIQQIIFGDHDRSFAQRTSCMSLDVMETGGQRIRRQQHRSMRDVMSTRDIRGATADSTHKFTDKPELEKISYQKTYYKPVVNKVRDMSLNCRDIPGAYPDDPTVSLRHTDPIQPEYQMPGHSDMTKAPYALPRSSGIITNYTADIEQSWPRNLIRETNYSRDPNNISDIEGAGTKPTTTRPRRQPRMSKFLYTDPEQKNKKLGGSQRAPSNPLDPVYNVSDQTPAWRNLNRPNKVLGQIPGSKPRKLQWSNGEPTFNLMTEDLPGATSQRWIGSVPINVYDPPSKKPVISFHDPFDIPGAQTGSNVAGIKAGQRIINPLQPVYKLLDGSSSMPDLRRYFDPAKLPQQK